MKAITLWPEWAWAVVRLDKAVENRTWAPSRGLHDHRIAIHAGKAPGGPSHRGGLARAFDPVFEAASRHGWDVIQAEFEELPEGVIARFSKEIHAWGPQVVDLRAEDVHLGAIVGSAVLAGATANGLRNRQWRAPGLLGWMMISRRRLLEPIPFRGAQGLWEVPDEIGAVVCEAVRSVSVAGP